MQEVVHEFEYQARGVFKDFHLRKQRWAVIVAHRRAGKTVACINDLLRRAIYENKENAIYAYIAPYYSQAKNIAWDYLVRFAGPALYKANQSELWVELVNGAKIRLFGADNPDSLRGLYLDGCILDEYADMKPKVWGEIVRPLLTDRRGFCVFIGTPKGHNNFWQIYNDATLDDNWYVKTIRASNSGLLPAEELLDAAKSMSEDQYLQEFECDFESAIVGAYWGKEMRELTDRGRITKVPYDPMFKVCTAWDLGRTDSTSIWWWQMVHGEIRVLEHHSSNGHDVDYYTDLILSKGYGYSTHWLPHDARAKTLASNKSVIEQISAKIPLESLKIVPNLSLQDGIQAARITLRKAWFDAEKCIEGIECLRQYQREWDDDKKMFRDKPKHDWTSHSADAWRYLSIAWREDEKIAPTDHSVKGIVVGENEVTMNELWESTPKTFNSRI